MKLMVVHGTYSGHELEWRRKHVLDCASAGTEIEFSMIKGDVLQLAPDGELLSMLAAPQIVEKAVEAEKLGFDAVMPYGALDFGVDIARRQVRIPVVGMGRASLCLAAGLASRIVVLVYQRASIPYARKFIREIGLQDFVTSVRALNMPLKDLTGQRDLLKERLVALGKQVVAEEDAEIIVPRGSSLISDPVWAEEISRAAGVPFVDPVAVGVRTAETLASMKLLNIRR